MAQNVQVAGAVYNSVPSILLPKYGGGTAQFTDTSPTTATASDVANGKIFFLADGTQATGTATSQGVSVVETPDSHGGTIVTITGAVFLTYYTGSSAPSSSLGIDGDIYLQT